MRWQAFVGGALLAFVLVASGASAHMGAVHVGTSADEDTPTPACIPTCEVRTTTYGNLAPATVVEVGTNVTWTVAEGLYHTVTSDDGVEDKRTTLVDGESTLGDRCLDSQVFESVTVEFRLHEGQLQAYNWSGEAPGWQTCEEAIGTPEGGFWLSYHCNVHPRNQNSALLVVPST